MHAFLPTRGCDRGCGTTLTQWLNSSHGEIRSQEKDGFATTRKPDLKVPTLSIHLFKFYFFLFLSSFFIFIFSLFLSTSSSYIFSSNFFFYPLPLLPLNAVSRRAHQGRKWTRCDSLHSLASIIYTVCVVTVTRQLAVSRGQDKREMASTSPPPDVIRPHPGPSSPRIRTLLSTPFPLRRVT